ncbi:MAG: TraB/GumN family protein [Bacteroidota bacterium]
MNLKKSWMLMFCLLLTASLQHLSAQDLPKSLLWKIEGNGIQPSYLYGTFHILPESEFDMKDKVKNAFSATEQLVMELDMDDPGMQTEMMKNLKMKDETTLKSLVSERDFALLDSVMSSTVGAGAMAFNQAKPFVITSMLLGRFIEGKTASFERSFTEMATVDEKVILGLESVTEQMSIFDQIPYQEQANDLTDMLRNEGQYREMFADMIKLYQAEDVTALFELTDQYMEGEGERELMLDQRNRNWIPKIGEMAKDKATFFGVGAAHLGGEAGVLTLLKEAGYQVSPVQ